MDERPVEFVTAIAATIDGTQPLDPDTQWTYDPDPEDVADAILAMPEMQAIAQFIVAEVWLRSTVRACAPAPSPDDRTDPIVFMGVDGVEYAVPRHVIEWALTSTEEP